MVDWSVVEHSVGASTVASTVCLPLWHLPFVSTAKTRWVSSSVIQWLLTSWTALLRRVFLARSSCSPHADSPHLPTFFLAYFMLTSSSPLERCTQRFRVDHFERLERLKKSLFARSSSNFSTEASVCSHFFRLISVLGSKNLVDAFSSKHSQLNWMNRIKWPETAFPMNKPIHLIIHQAAMLLANIRPNRRPQAAISLWFTVVERGSNCDGRGEQPGDRASGKFDGCLVPDDLMRSPWAARLLMEGVKKFGRLCGSLKISELLEESSKRPTGRLQVAGSCIKSDDHCWSDWNDCWVNTSIFHFLFRWSAEGALDYKTEET